MRLLDQLGAQTRPEHKLKHPDQKAVAADHSDREDGPYENRKNEKCEEFLAPPIGRSNLILRVGAAGKHGRSPNDRSFDCDATTLDQGPDITSWTEVQCRSNQATL
jgi:hypothetical protein